MPSEVDQRTHWVGRPLANCTCRNIYDDANKDDPNQANRHPGQTGDLLTPKQTRSFWLLAHRRCNSEFLFTCLTA